jgi:hypothetical protein
MIVVGAASSPVYAETSSGTTGTASSTVKLKFPDVKSTYWGARHISKLALEGIIEGYEDGSYRAESSVSQQEVIVMAIRMMGLENEVKALKGATAFPDYLKVDDFFNGYVTVAINKGLIKQDEEKLLPNNSKTKWGARNANREWVAKITIRAIGQQATADGLASAPTSFTDNTDIAYSNLGYINAAVSLKIVDGFEDGSFKPGGAVTRAQMATFLSRSQKNMASLPSRVVKGYLNSLASGSISIMDKNGEISKYTLSSDTVFYGNKNDENIVPSTIQQTYEVSLIQVNGTAYFVEVLKDELQMDVYEGTLFKVNVNDLTLTYFSSTANDYVQKELSSDVTVTDKDGRGLSLGTLMKDSIIELKKSKISKSPKITQIVVKQVPVNKSAEGTIQTISKSENKLTMLESSTNTPESFTVSGQAIIASTDNTLINLDGLHAGDIISYDVVNSQIAKITVKKQADVGITVTGTFQELNADKTTLNYIKTAGGILSADFLANNVQVIIDGLPNAGLFDLEKGDLVTLEKLNNKITKITATNRAVSNNYFAKIISYDAPTKYLLVQDSKGDPQAYTLTDKTIVNYMGNTLPFANFASTFTSGKRIDLKVSNGKVISIDFSTQIDGSISQLNVLANEVSISIKTKSGQLLSFKNAYQPTIEVPNKATSTISDLLVGDPVSLTLSFDQNIITKIAVNKSFAYKIALTDTSNKKVTVVNDEGALVAYDLSEVPLVNQNQSAALITDFITDEYTKLTFKGSKITKAEIVSLIRGKITALDATSSSITVQDFSGNNKVIGLGANYLLKQNGGGVINFDALKVGDRVQIMKDANDRMQIQVASSAQKVFSSYDNLLNRINVLPGNAADKTYFYLYAKVYVHTDSQLITLGSLAVNDVLTIYMLDDKAVEILKK